MAFFTIGKAFLLVLFVSSCPVFGEPHGFPPSAAPEYGFPGHEHHHGMPPSLAPEYHHRRPGHPPMEAPSPSHHHHLEPPPSHSPEHDHHHHHRSVPPPAPAPSKHHHHHFPRSFLAVQGVVYCKSCKYARFDTVWDATPIAGATVKLICEKDKDTVMETATTDKNGYFFITAPKGITSYESHECKVYLASSPSPACKTPSDLYGGTSGAHLRPEKSYYDNKNFPFELYTVGPFAFEPTCPH